MSHHCAQGEVVYDCHLLGVLHRSVGAKKDQADCTSVGDVLGMMTASYGSLHYYTIGINGFFVSLLHLNNYMVIRIRAYCEL